MSLAAMVLLVLRLVLMVGDAATGFRIVRCIRLALSHSESSSSEETITRGEKPPLLSASPRLRVELCVVGQGGEEREFGRRVSVVIGVGDGVNGG